MSKIKVTPSEFQVLSKYILEVSGIALAAGKEYLVETRLSNIMDALQCPSYNDLYSKAKRDHTHDIEKKIIDAISTNETYFFRDNTPFDLIQHKLIPDLIDRRSKNTGILQKTGIRIWSSASSTGQEIYSISMILKDMGIDYTRYNIKLLATDISDAAIAQASYGKYNRFEVTRGLSKQRLERYFNPDGDYWRIKDEIRAMVTFKKLNLMKPFTGLGKFDMILCRNVAIYFTAQDRKMLFERISEMLEPDGVLIIGSTESLTNEISFFQPQRYLNSTFYVRK
ncbi:MAG: protein-glutamate O-methyltransferase CheR [Proteobacteria bacterium]|nr:protein-glutamate O-methyltransferase CheR [Pseudomonadota bacterium]